MSPSMLPRVAAAPLPLVRRSAWPTRTAQFALARRTLSTVRKFSHDDPDDTPEPPAKTFTVAARLDDGLLALRPSMGVSSASVKPGALLSLGDTARAAILCWRSGLAITAPLTSTPPPPAGAELELLGGEALSLRASAALGGRVVDALGAPLDRPADDEVADGTRQPLFAAAPAQAQLQPIAAGLRTGTTAVDALTPIGRGQSMLVVGRDGVGKSSLLEDALLAQASSDLRCVVALSGAGGAADGAALLARLGARSAALRERTTVVVAGGEDDARTPPAAARALAAAAAVAVAEATRDGGGHALVVLDGFDGHTGVWDAAAAAAEAYGGGGGGGDKAQQSAEQRIFYAALLQRAAQLNDAEGGGSLTLLLAVADDPDGDGAGEAAAAAEGGGGGGGFAASDFGAYSEQVRKRVEALAARGIPLDRPTLERIGIRPPAAAAAPPPPLAGAALHLDQLRSLSDGHIELSAARFAAGYRPALRPVESLFRVGAGSAESAQRAQPWPPAMAAVASSLRLELAQAADLGASPAAGPHEALQRTRAAALEAALFSQRAGAPLRLSEQVALLAALGDGRLDDLADAPRDDAPRLVAELLAHVRGAAAAAMDAVDATGALSDDAHAQIRAAVADLRPHASGRAFYVSWDTEAKAEGGP